MTRYRVHTPPIPDGQRIHGGVRALHRLADELRARDQHADIVDFGARGSVWTDPGVDVWPEIHPAIGERPVEWLLAPRTFTAPERGQSFAWEAWLEPGTRLLQVPITDLVHFHPPGPGTRRRGGTVFYRGKGPAAKVPRHVTEITRTWPAKREELADLLRDATELVTTDGLTALALEAVLCGCPVVFIGPAARHRGHHAFNLTGTHGYCYTQEDLPAARAAARDAFPDYVDRALPAMHRSIDRFIEATS